MAPLSASRAELIRFVNSKPTHLNTTVKLPWWIYPLAFGIFHLGTHASILTKVTTGTSLFYLPAPFALVLVYWWGPRILPVFYLNAIVSCPLWGLDDPLLYPLYAFPELLFASLSWLLFIRLGKGKFWLPDIKHVLLFLFLGLLLPLVPNKIMLESLFWYFGETSEKEFYTVLVWSFLGDFNTIFGMSVPLLYFLSAPMDKAGLCVTKVDARERFLHLISVLKARYHWLEFAAVLGIAVLMHKTLNFADYWYLYGMLSLHVSMRFGFGMLILANSFFLLISYIAPAVTQNEFTLEMIANTEMVRVQLGSAILFVYSMIIGRVMSDVGAARKIMLNQRGELMQTNQELDRFVYSVSHDLSAPLKSIRGLVNLTKIEKKPEDAQNYLVNIERSVSKLENFIQEILDYSRNERQAVMPEAVNVKAICNDVLDNLKYDDAYALVEIRQDALQPLVIETDKMRLKMILNNLISNAMKFQRHSRLEKPFIRLSAEPTAQGCVIEVEDNGEGIQPELKQRIFDMFFRGSPQSKGSGLGLYIAKEAAEKIMGKITVESTYGKGSLFRLTLQAKVLRTS